MKVFRAAAWIITAACCISSAQEGPPIRSKGEEVLLDVIVRDKKGAAITKLGQNDFSVFDNGSRKPIKGFRLVHGGSAVDASGKTTDLDPMRQIRLVSLIFGRMDQSGRTLSRQAALDFLKTDLPPNVQAAVFVLDKNLKAIQPFTNRRDLLVQAVEVACSRAYTDFSAVSEHVRTTVEQAIGPNQYGRQSLEEQAAAMDTGNTGRGPNSQAVFAQFAAQVILEMLRFSERAEVIDSGRDTIYALLSAVQGQSQLPGRKAILYFSEGFFLPQGAEDAFRSIISAANRNNLSFYPVDSRGLITTAMNASATSHLGVAAQASADNGSGTAIGDSHITTNSALSPDQALESGRYNYQETLAVLANETGGFLTANTNDFRGPVQRMAEDLETYYEISYDPEIAAYDGSFHRVEVKTARPDLRVQTREGYFALPHSAMQKGLSAFELPLLRALTVTPPAHAFPFESGAMHFRGEDRTMTCGFLIDMPMSNITVREDKQKGIMSGGVAYVALVKNDRGDVVKKLQGDIPIQLKPGDETMFKQSRFTDMEYFDIPPGRYTVGVALIDKESGLTTARHSALFVPAISSGLAMSSVALIRKWRPKEPEAASDDPFVVGDKAVTPTLTPKINKSVSTSLPFYFVAYPNASNTAPVTLTIEFDRDGKSKRVAVADLPKPDAEGRIQYVANAPIEQFSPGNYAVRFIVRQGTEVVQENFAILLEP